MPTYVCNMCDKPEADCNCDKYCILCKSTEDCRLCFDGCYYCQVCRDACDLTVEG